MDRSDGVRRDGQEGVPEPSGAPDSMSLQGVPAHVASCLVTAVEAARGRNGTPVAGASRDDGDAVRRDAAEVIRAARCVQAWAESVETGGARRLLSGIENDCGVDLGAAEPGSTRATRRREARRAAAAELEVLTGLSAAMCRDRVALASATQVRAGYLRARMEAGTLDAYRAITLVKETRHLDPVTADGIARAALVPLGREVSDPTDLRTLATEIDIAGVSLPVSQGTFRRRVKRQLTKAESAAGLAARRAKERAGARDVRTDDGPYGTATTWIDATRDRAYAAQHRVEAIARAARQAGDERTLAQLRSDIATDLLIHGTVPGDQILGAPPPARLNVYVGLATLLPGQVERGVRSGTDTPAGQAFQAFQAPIFDADGLGEVPGRGFLPAEQVRRVSLAVGSTWRRLVTDPMTGTVLEACRTYRPTQAMRELVTARDRTCRAPGCTIAAGESDLDHDVPWLPGATTPAEGATHPDNLHALHRGHHHAKTRRWWRSTQGSDGVVHWCTLTGQSITTRPPGEEVVRIGTDNPSAPMVVVAAQILDDEFDPPAMLDSELAMVHVATSARP